MLVVIVVMVVAIVMFMSIVIVVVPFLRWLRRRLGRCAGLGDGGFVDLLQVLVRVFLERVLARRAAESDLAAFVFDDRRFAHLAELFVGNNAHGQRVIVLGFGV